MGSPAPKKVYENLGPSSSSRPPIIWSGDELPQDPKKEKKGGEIFKLNSLELEGLGGKLTLILSHF